MRFINSFLGAISVSARAPLKVVLAGTAAENLYGILISFFCASVIIFINKHTRNYKLVQRKKIVFFPVLKKLISRL